MLIEKLLKLLPTKAVYAHCDIPCGIYDPHLAQMAAHTVLRMTQLFNEATQEGEGETPHKQLAHKLFRYTIVKEKHGHIIEEEIETLWADYFKEEHLKEYPQLNDLILKTVKLTGKVRQEVNLEAAEELLKNVQEIAEIFWKTKGFEPIRIKSGYPTEGEIVSHQ